MRTLNWGEPLSWRNVAVLALVAALTAGGVRMALAGDDADDNAIRREEQVQERVQAVDDDPDDDGTGFQLANTGDGDDTRGNDGTNGGNNTGDGDDTRGNDGTNGGDNTGDGDATAGNDGTNGGDNTGDGDATDGNDGTNGGDNTAAGAGSVSGGGSASGGGTDG